MLNRWNKSLIALAALALALPMVANAQTSRVEGMSAQGDYIKDYTAIYTYASQVSHVGNLIYAETGDGSSNGDRAMGAVLGNLWEGRYGTWAIHLRQWTPSIGQGDVTSHPGVGGGFDPNENNSHSFDIMWGKRFGGTSLGFRLNRSFYENEENLPTVQSTLTLAGGDNFRRNVFGIGAGIGFEVNPSSTFEAGLQYQSRKFEDTTSPIGGGTNVSEDSPTSYLLAARLMWQWQPNVMVVPVFKWYSFDLSTKSTTGAVTTTADNSLKGWQIGAAGNWTLNQNDLFVLGVTFARNTVEQDAPLFFSGIDRGNFNDNSKIEESIYPQIFASLETHVNSWLTLRFGAAQDVMTKIKADPRVAADGQYSQTFSRFNMNMGAGVKVGGLQFDAVLDNYFYNEIGYTMTGVWTPFPKVTATYAF